MIYDVKAGQATFGHDDNFPTGTVGRMSLDRLVKLLAKEEAQPEETISHLKIDASGITIRYERRGRNPADPQPILRHAYRSRVLNGSCIDCGRVKGDEAHR